MNFSVFRMKEKTKPTNEEERENIEEQKLANYLNNISEFAKHNSIASFDNCEESQQFIKGLLMSLEFLALNWEMIDHDKYKHRFTNLNRKDNKLPADAYC